MASLLDWLQQQSASRPAAPSDLSTASPLDRPNGLMADNDLLTKMLGAYLAGPMLANQVATRGASDVIGLPGDAISAVAQAGQRLNGANPNPSQTSGPLPGTNDVQRALASMSLQSLLPSLWER